MFKEEFKILFKIIQKELKISRENVISKSRKGEIVDARRIIIFIAKKNSKLSLNKIGKFVGGRDHATVLNSIKKHKQLYITDAEYTEKFNRVNYAYLSSSIVAEKMNYAIHQLRARKKSLTKYINEQIINIEKEKNKKQESSLKIGLFMGSFNPIHNGHMVIANTALHQCDFDEVWFVVSPESPDKENHSEMLSFDSRVEMINNSIIDNPRLSVCDVEKNLPKPSYTINTLKALKKKYKNYEFSIILGSDNVENIHKWKSYNEIVLNNDIYFFKRPNSNSNQYIKNSKRFNIKEIVSISNNNISSTGIRNVIKNGKSIEQLRYLVPDECLFLIEEKGYYKKINKKVESV